MKLIKMCYRGLIFSVNPSSMTAKMEKKENTKIFPFSKAQVDEICEMPATITGSGSFFGENKDAEAHALMKAFKRQGSAYLFSPVFAPVKAFFKELNIKYNAEKNCVDYDFVFVEDTSGKKPDFNFGYTFAKSGENLYDVANRTGCNAKDLFEKNDFMDMFSVEEGDRIWLC